MYKNSRSTVLLPLVVAAAVALGIFLGQFLGRSSAESDIKGILRSLALPQNKVSQTLSLIETQYVDSVAIDSLVERALPVIVSELDPHSVYIPASEMAEINEPLDGEFDGIGVVFNMATDTVIVLNVIPSGPSDKAGVVAGDRIVRINDSLVAGQQIAQREIMRRLRGKRGSEVRLGLERRGIDELVEVTVVRDKIPIRSLTAALMLTGDIAFVKLDQFARTSHTELLEALSTLRTQGMRKLILDLRGNSGGFLDQAIAIANEFLPADKLIVYTEDRNHQRIEQYSDGTGSAADLDLAVLVDEGSASSSEILAGALQDNDRGTIIGRRSFGKGLVQQQIPYADGSALRLTVARYYTPTGRSIQKPYTSGDAESYDADIWNRYQHNEFFSADSIRFDDALRRTTPGGKVVYGGGGIMPDERIDPEYISRFAMTLYAMGYVDDFADLYFREHGMQRIDPRTFTLTDADYERFEQFMADKEVKYESDTRRALNRIKEAARADLYEESLAAEIEAIEAGIRDDKATNLQTYKREIMETLNGAVILRYSYAEGVTEHTLTEDREVHRAVALLDDGKEYARILHEQDTVRK